MAGEGGCVHTTQPCTYLRGWPLFCHEGGRMTVFLMVSLFYFFYAHGAVPCSSGAAHLLSWRWRGKRVMRVRVVRQLCRMVWLGSREPPCLLPIWSLARSRVDFFVF